MEFGLYCYSLRLFGEQKTQRAICWAGILVSTRTCPAIYWELFISDHWELPLDKSVLSFLKAVYCSHLSSTISYPVYQIGVFTDRLTIGASIIRLWVETKLGMRELSSVFVRSCNRFHWGNKPSECILDIVHQCWNETLRCNSTR